MSKIIDYKSQIMELCAKEKAQGFKSMSADLCDGIASNLMREEEDESKFKKLAGIYGFNIEPEKVAPSNMVPMEQDYDEVIVEEKCTSCDFRTFDLNELTEYATPAVLVALFRLNDLKYSHTDKRVKRLQDLMEKTHGHIRIK